MGTSMALELEGVQARVISTALQAGRAYISATNLALICQMFPFYSRGRAKWHLHWVAKLFFKWGFHTLHEVNNLKATGEVFGAVLGWAFDFFFAYMIPKSILGLAGGLE
jgi:hypothetical protein